MDLKDFVKNSLTQIAEGILAASEALKNTDAQVNPTEIVVNSNSSQAYGRTCKAERSDDPTRVVEKVDFDVALSVQEGETTNASLKVSVMSIRLGAGGESNSTLGSQSRIKFSVPMVLPSKRT